MVLAGGTMLARLLSVDQVGDVKRVTSLTRDIRLGERVLHGDVELNVTTADVRAQHNPVHSHLGTRAGNRTWSSHSETIGLEGLGHDGDVGVSTYYYIAGINTENYCY